MKKKILIVEDEVKIASLLQDYLQQNKFDTHSIHHGDEVASWLKDNKVDLILLDIMLPGKDGLEICRETRKTMETPIIFITARVEEIDRLLGLELGADDYICKPFSPREVVARVKAVLRRFAPQTQADSGLKLDETTYQIQCNDQSVELTAVEFQLFKVMFDRPGQIFSRQQLMDSTYNDQRIVSTRTIDSHIKKLRKKCQQLSDGEIIHSVYGVGYRFDNNG